MMVEQELVIPLAIGLAVGALLYVPLARGTLDQSARRAIGVAAFSMGFVVTMVLWKNQAEAERWISQIMGLTQQILVAALGVALAYYAGKRLGIW